MGFFVPSWKCLFMFRCLFGREHVKDCEDRLAFGDSLKWPFEEVHASALEHWFHF